MFLPDSWTFADRVALLLGVLVLFALADWMRHRQEATRWREYLFLASAGILGAAFGAMIDLITSSISADYFIAGKGLSPGVGFKLEVATLGAQAGLVGGVVVGSLLLLANQPREGVVAPPLLLIRLLATCWRVFAFAVLSAILGGGVASIAKPTWFSIDLEGILDDAAIRGFTTVFCTHLGVYVGAVVGLVLSVRSIRRARAIEATESAVTGRS